MNAFSRLVLPTSHMEGIYGILCRSPKFRSSFRGSSQVFKIMEDSLFIIRQKANLLSISERKTCYNIFNEFKTDISAGLPKANLYFRKVAKALLSFRDVDSY
jgi:hypothetical protein